MLVVLLYVVTILYMALEVLYGLFITSSFKRLQITRITECIVCTECMYFMYYGMCYMYPPLYVPSTVSELNCMEQSPFLKANRSSSGQGIPHIL